MGLRGLWICPRSHTLIGSISHDGSLSANHWRRGHIASENHGWFRHRPLIARSRKLSLMMPGCYAPLSHFRMKLGAAGAGGQKSADRLRRQAVGGCFRTAKQNARRLGALERRYLDPDVTPWGRWATLGLGLTAMLVGQMTALTAVMRGTGDVQSVSHI